VEFEGEHAQRLSADPPFVKSADYSTRNHLSKSAGACTMRGAIPLDAYDFD
jgi:hypothetical protein